MAAAAAARNCLCVILAAFSEMEQLEAAQAATSNAVKQQSTLWVSAVHCRKFAAELGIH